MSPTFDAAACRTTLFSALLDAAAEHGHDKPIIEDVERQPLTYGRLILASLVLGGELAKLTHRNETVGLMLPNVNGMAVTLFGLNAYGRVAALLNFSSGIKNLRSTILTGAMRTLVTSRRFIATAKLEDLVNDLATLEVAPGKTLEDPLSRGHPQAHRPQGQDRRPDQVENGRPRPSPPRARARSARRHSLHVGNRGRAEGRRAVERQPRLQCAPDLRSCRGPAQRCRHGDEPAADVPFVRPDRRIPHADPQRHEDDVLSKPPPLQGDPGPDRGDRIDRALRDGHLPARLCPRG